MSTPVDQYRSAAAAEAAASPHKVVELLYSGIIERLNAARGAISSGEVEHKINSMNSAMDILEILRAGLDRQAGGDIAVNLDALYDYMTRRMLTANVRNDVEPLDETLKLMRELKAAWDGIADKV